VIFVRVRPEMDPALQLIMDQFKELKTDIIDMIQDKVGTA